VAFVQPLKIEAGDVERIPTTDDVQFNIVQGAQIVADDGGTAGHMVFDAGSTAAVSAAGTGRIRFDEATNALQISNNGGAYTDIGAAAGNTLQQAYVAGATIAVTTAEGSVALSNAADLTDILTIDRTFVGAGNGISVTMGEPGDEAVTGIGVSVVSGTGATGAMLFVNNQGSGNALQVQDGGSDVFTVNGAGAVSADPTSGQDFTVDTNGAGDMLFVANGTGDFSVATGGNVSLDAQGDASTAFFGNGNGAAVTNGDVTIESRNTNAGGTSGNIFIGSVNTAAAAGVQGVEIRAGGTAFTTPTAGEVQIVSEALDIVFDARGATTPITVNEAGDTDLDGGFTATSIIGALNELLAGGGGTNSDTYRWVVNGKPAVANGVDNAWIAPRAGTITRITLFRRTAGSSGSTIVDVDKNGTTVYTTQANRPTVTAAGGNNQIDATTDMDVTAVAQNDRLEVNVDAVEAGNPQDISIILEIEYT
jgi:hypothetical protein